MNILEKLKQLEIEASDYGFKWENPHQIMSQIKSKCDEIDEHLNNHDSDKSKLQEEIGDLLHAVFSLTVFCQFDPKTTLENSVNKFERRFNQVKFLAQEKELETLNDMSFDELMQFWDQAKKEVG
ncbi:MAG: nucleoside triphosphate hydrolase [Gammaproteobacteria bacterium RIFCSPHIGHO2_12_FULL_38_11]|nr:MAG: nucleoside triphosphate hydrolase [Gammaproteobacteria bacterium RIFCSPHIGHO2_12_FULL_38_11]